MNRRLSCALMLSAAILLAIPPAAISLTNQDDVIALVNLYTSLNSPSQLTSWTSSGSGDPCGQAWKGVQCSGSSVVEINLSGLGLGGGLGYMLSKFASLTVLDISNNQISGSIPYSLPPYLQTLKLGNNNLGGTLPFSISTMLNSTYIDLSHNQIGGTLGELFSNLGSLTTIDVSFNAFTGSLPQSFSQLYSLSSLYLEDNQLSGDLNVLADLLHLENVNVENNKFTGWIPQNLKSISNFRNGGNSFDSSPAPPPPPYVPPPPAPKASTSPGKTSNPRSSSTGSSKSSKGSSTSTSTSSSGLGLSALIGLVVACILGLVVAGLIIMFFVWKPRNKYIADEEKQQSISPAGPLVPLVTKDVESGERNSTLALDTTLNPSSLKATEKPGKKSFIKKPKGHIASLVYSVADLQVATNSFGQENLIAEGALGPVYRAEFTNSKVFAVKKIDTSAVPCLRTEEGFMEFVSNASHIHHKNIAELVGYCTEHDQRLLVYGYYSEGSLRDALHASDENVRKDMTWNARMKIALGIARALEYLHEVSQPAIVHKSLKSSNVLLDDELNPYLSDFLINASNPEHQSLASGYSAPEYGLSGVHTWQSDVYSFGVMMLELLTGRMALDTLRPRVEQSLVRWATPQLHDIDALESMVDPTLNGTYPAKSLSRFADIIALCVQPEMEFRPPMSEVVQSLVRLMQRASLNKPRSGDDNSD